MLGKVLGCLLCFGPLQAEARPPFGPPGYELPERVTDQNLFQLSDRMDRGGCKTRDCRVLTLAIGQILTNGNQRKNPHLSWEDHPPDIAYSAIKYREIERELRLYRELWPDICRAVVEIGARDVFDTYPEPYSDIAPSALDVSRHLRGPGLDCFAKTLAAMPQSRALQASLSTVWDYCLDERRGTARCERYKPTDPEFLPAKE